MSKVIVNQVALALSAVFFRKQHLIPCQGLWIVPKVIDELSGSCWFSAGLSAWLDYGREHWLVHSLESAD